MTDFDVEKQTEACTEWVRNWMSDKGPDSKIIIGMSGGVDSTTTGKICVKAIGADRVIGLRLPNGIQKDIDDAKLACDELGIKSYEINIWDAYKGLTKNILSAFSDTGMEGTVEGYTTNTPARLRMTAIYGVAAQLGNSYPVNTCNLSETAEGYDTVWGDSTGAFAPIARFTKTEVRAIAKYLGLPERLYNKTPIDGMSTNADGSYKSDEDKLGFSYEELDDFLRNGTVGPNNEKIVNGMKKNIWKRRYINLDYYEPNLPFFAKNLW